MQYFGPALSHNQSCKTIFGLLLEWPLKTGFTVTYKMKTWADSLEMPGQKP